MPKNSDDKVYLSQSDCTELRSLIASARNLSRVPAKDALLNEIALAITLAQTSAADSGKPQQIILDVRP